MRLYRFIETTEKIDVTVVTDGSKGQKNVFITEIRGIVTPGSVNPTEDEIAGSDAIQAMGFNFTVGTEVMDEELRAFATKNELTLEITPEGLGEEKETITPDED